MKYYAGWWYHFDGVGSQGWKAYRWGVRICANTESLLKQMMDRQPTLPN